jgi:alpha,alpha-trehalose-phosphate synthase [UDP-forming]
MSRLFVVSNRLPVTVDVDGGQFEVRPSSGGLVSALTAVFQRTSGAWVGWPGVPSFEQELKLSPDLPGMELIPVFLTERERRDFYCGFSNEIIWPLFHDLQSRCNFDPAYWKAYVEVNQRFTKTVLEKASPDDLIWVHDYHLALMGSMLREAGRPNAAYFQHIPFPSPDIFEKLPWGAELIQSLLDFRVIGFQTYRDVRNFSTCVRSMGNNRVRKWDQEYLIEHKHGISVAKAFPISIDFSTFASAASSTPVEERLASMRAEFGDRQVVLGIDRLDYTKGIPERLRGFSRTLDLYPELRKRISLVQVVVPSRENIPKYLDLKMEVERLVSEINGRFSEGGWVPIHFVYRHLERSELLAYYRLADVALITPLKDGMNLVSKEYCAADVEEDGVLIISQFAGAAAELETHALCVNPNDYDRVAQQLHRALSMTAIERKKRMSRLREHVRRYDVNHWVDNFLQECGERLTEHQSASIPNNKFFVSTMGRL